GRAPAAPPGTEGATTPESLRSPYRRRRPRWRAAARPGDRAEPLTEGAKLSGTGDSGGRGHASPSRPGAPMTASHRSLAELEHHGGFVERHVGPDAGELREMLELLGYGSLDELTDAVVPSSIRWDKPLDLGAPLTEQEMLARLRAI